MLPTVFDEEICEWQREAANFACRDIIMDDNFTC